MKGYASQYRTSNYSDGSEIVYEKTYEQKRWEAALVAMQGFISNPTLDYDKESYDTIAVKSFGLAEAMLRHEQELLNQKS